MTLGIDHWRGTYTEHKLSTKSIFDCSCKIIDIYIYIYTILSKVHRYGFRQTLVLFHIGAYKL